MRYLSILFLTAFSSIASANEPLTPRPVDQLSSETFQAAMVESVVVRRLVARLESSNVIVHIETARVMPAGIGGYTRFVVSRGGYRYLRITLSAMLRGDTRSAILAHELQHACEVADSTADDVVALRQLFSQSGRRDGGYFETRAAIDVERMVRREVRLTAAAAGAGRASIAR